MMDRASIFGAGSSAILERQVRKCQSGDSMIVFAHPTARQVSPTPKHKACPQQPAAAAKPPCQLTVVILTFDEEAMFQHKYERYAQQWDYSLKSLPLRTEWALVNGCRLGCIISAKQRDLAFWITKQFKFAKKQTLEEKIMRCQYCILFHLQKSLPCFGRLTSELCRSRSASITCPHMRDYCYSLAAYTLRASDSLTGSKDSLIA